MDDASTDNSSAAIIQELPKYPRLSNRLTLLQNKFPIGALGNRDSVTRKFCGPGDIVMDIDGDDALIGKQAFNFSTGTIIIRMLGLFTLILFK